MKNLFYLLVTVFLFVSCKNNDDCEDLNVATTSLEAKYGCVNTKYQMDIDLSQTFTVIKNQTDYNALVTGSCQPNIDFVTYDLVIGKQALGNGNTSINYELIENCQTGNQTLKVTFNQNETTVAPNLTYHALIPKLKEGQELNVEITLK